ncbi:hypothetical protein RMR10_025180 (plasmid) [Agrobacterium rosae]|uniref:hypothetical protein n=1 Tax=Agrobacterium rosae TaxID=1972867 RepID=UPI002A16C9B7|nr:hypothetical protein [Agrobacterium rosae]MDX8316102.1 hypothetical protein [Agrobacterium rosae]
MNIKRTLTAIAGIVAEEASRNAEFRARLEDALSAGVPGSKVTTKPPETTPDKRKGGRRAPAVLDPVELAAQGEEILRARLAELETERLLDIVAQFGMDPGKLVMKWKDNDRIIDRVVEVALGRATKGDAFRKD